jgi:hypothetical protein
VTAPRARRLFALVAGATCIPIAALAACHSGGGSATNDSPQFVCATAPTPGPTPYPAVIDAGCWADAEALTSLFGGTGGVPSAAGIGAWVQLQANLGAGAANAIVTFNGIPATIVGYDAFNFVLTAVVPVGATSGPVMIVNGCSALVSASPFAILPTPAPIVSGVTPGPTASSGTIVTLTGQYLTGTGAVFIGDASTYSNFIAIDDNTLQFNAFVGVGPVGVMTGSGLAYGDAGLTVQ